MSIFVVTGGAGFIGSNLATQISQAGHEVRVFDNFTAAAARVRLEQLQMIPTVTIVRGDIRDQNACLQVCEGADFVLHHAAEASVPRSVEDPADCADNNVGGTINMLVAAQKSRTVKRFVFASSCAVYGDSPSLSKSEFSLIDPITPYATSKLAGEYFCNNFFRLHDLSTVVLRYFNVYGPGQDPSGAYAAVIPKFMTAITDRQKPIIYGDGEQSRDFVFIDDIVAANLCAIHAPRSVAGKVFNIGSGQKTSLNQLVENLASILHQQVPIEKREPRAGDIKHSCADISAAKEFLKFEPSVPLDKGLARTLQWYQLSAQKILK